MLILVNMANIDPEKSAVYQKDFDDFVRFYKAHPSSIDDSLMCWLMVSNEYEEESSSNKIIEIVNTP